MRALVLFALLIAACSSGGGEGVSYADLRVETLRAGDIEFRVWIADSDAARARGLMDATDEDLAPTADGAVRGMLFVFPVPEMVSFWMRGTEVALDLAYIDETGRIVEVLAMTPLDETPRPSPVPVSYALEVRAGTLADLGLGVGDVLTTP